MAKKLTDDQIRTFQQYGLNVKEITQQREFPGFDFSIFEGMDDAYYQIRSEYLKLKSNPDYSEEFKAKKRQEALAAIDTLKADYLEKALRQIDRTYRKPKQKKQGPSMFTLTTNDMVLQELQRNREFAVLQEQIKVEPPAKLLDLYHQHKDDPDIVTLLELELRQRKDIPGGDPAAIEAWTEIQADLNGGQIVASHWESKIRSVLNVDAPWFPVGLAGGFEAAKYEEIEL
jgi:hypothetical protein